MIVADILFSLATALFLSVLFAVAFARSTPFLSSLWWLQLVGFFALVFLSSWAGGVWLRKAPAIGLAAPYVAAIAIAVVFLLASGGRVPNPSGSGVASRQDIGLFQAVLFVILLLALAVVIVFGYGPAA